MGLYKASRATAKIMNALRLYSLAIKTMRMATPMAPENSIIGPGDSVARTTRMLWLMNLPWLVRNFSAAIFSRL